MGVRKLQPGAVRAGTLAWGKEPNPHSGFCVDELLQVPFCWMLVTNRKFAGAGEREPHILSPWSLLRPCLGVTATHWQYITMRIIPNELAKWASPQDGYHKRALVASFGAKESAVYQEDIDFNFRARSASYLSSICTKLTLLIHTSYLATD